jgi:hypothetical protein
MSVQPSTRTRTARLVAQTVARAYGIRRMQRRRVIVADGGRDAALRVAGVALGRCCLGEDENAARRRQTDCCPQAGDAAADDEEIYRKHANVILPPHPMDPVRIDVSTPSRPIHRDDRRRLLDRVGEMLDAIGAPPRRFVVSSPLVWRLHGEQLSRAVTLAEPILVPDGERFKQLSTVSRIYDALVRGNADRAATIITFGGGVIGDMAGFAAATVSARHRRRPCADDAARAGRQRHWRQGRRQPYVGQEHDRRLLSSRTPF